MLENFDFTLRMSAENVLRAQLSVQITSLVALRTMHFQINHLIALAQPKTTPEAIAEIYDRLGKQYESEVLTRILAHFGE